MLVFKSWLDDRDLRHNGFRGLYVLTLYDVLRPLLLSVLETFELSYRSLEWQWRKHPNIPVTDYYNGNAILYGYPNLCYRRYMRTWCSDDVVID